MQYLYKTCLIYVTDKIVWVWREADEMVDEVKPYSFNLAGFGLLARLFYCQFCQSFKYSTAETNVAFRFRIFQSWKDSSRKVSFRE